MKANLMALVGAATVLAASVTGASAQVLNLTGQFQWREVVPHDPAGVRIFDAGRLGAEPGE
jgi:hypothetical protein